MTVLTIVIPDRGQSDASDVVERLTDYVTEVGGEVLQATIVDECDGDLDTCDARRR